MKGYGSTMCWKSRWQRFADYVAAGKPLLQGNNAYGAVKLFGCL